MISSSFAFFGSPRFARIILEKLAENNIIPSVLICNPDKPFGRKKIVTPPLTKQFVLEKNLPVKIFQPETKEALAKIMGSSDIARNRFAVLAAYSKILPQEVIAAFPLGIVGVHPSLLPLHRGASPIQAAILEGDEVSGTTIFLIDEKTDHGPILGMEEMSISDFSYNYEKLEEELAVASANVLIRTLPLFAEGKIVPKPQDEFKATYTKKFITEDGLVDLKKDNPEMVARKIRALNPDPGTYTMIGNKRIKLLEVSRQPDGSFVITKIQPEGKIPQPAALKLPFIVY
jgi:methionyl-tRNA formyltransferase